MCSPQVVLQIADVETLYNNVTAKENHSSESEDSAEEDEQFKALLGTEACSSHTHHCSAAAEKSITSEGAVPGGMSRVRNLGSGI